LDQGLVRVGINLTQTSAFTAVYNFDFWQKLCFIEKRWLLFKGELALNRHPETTTVSKGVKASNAIIMETDPENLAVKSNR